MRFLGIGDYNALADMHWRLARAGHEVRVHVAKPEAADIFEGLLERTPDWQRELGWIRAAGEDGVIVFESADQGPLQDRLRKEGFQVIGGSAFGDRLENDRAFAQSLLSSLGLNTARKWQFTGHDEAIAFIGAHPDRYVHKLNDSQAASHRSYVGMRDDGADLRALLRMERARQGGRPASFVLMQHLQGVEVGVGAYFDGERFLDPPLLDWEHKRFFPGDLGELTGEMGTVVTYRGARRIFEASLARCAPALREGGYCGYINLNTIINAEGLWPLEFTSRFGYPGFAICDALHADRWDAIFRRMLQRRGGGIATHDGYAVGVVGTVPPFPFEQGYDELSRGAPIFLDPDLGEEQRDHLHFAEAGQRDGQWVCAGAMGYIVVATGRGADVRTAQAAAYGLIGKLAVPRLRYRNDIGERFVRGDHAALKGWGWME